MKLQGVDDWTPGPMKPYDELLERLYKIIEEHNPTVGHILSVSKDFSFFWVKFVEQNWAHFFEVLDFVNKKGHNDIS